MADGASAGHAVRDGGYRLPDLAAVYDRFNGWGPDRDHYLDLVMTSDTVVDLGCGTGLLLAEARRRGHAGRLVGVDPAPAMLDVARERAPDVEWVEGTIASVGGGSAADLVVMTGHAFQHLLTDEELDATLAGVARVLRPGGEFAFETRNPGAREWEQWHDTALEQRDPQHGRVTIHWTVDAVDGDLVAFTERFEGAGPSSPVTSTSTLRFLGADEVVGRLLDHGFMVTGLAGDFDGSAPTSTAPELVVRAVLGRPPTRPRTSLP